MKPLMWATRSVVVVLAGAMLLTAATVAVAPRLWRIANAHEEIPVALHEFAAQSQRSVVFDAAGQEITAFELENSEPVDLDDIPDHVADAFLAVEDKDFWTHDGVNVRSLMRAALSSYAADGPGGGASTITMQVVKNDYLAGLERDGRYKMLQITYAVRLEKQKSKRDILERYLNTAFFGQNSYGIGAAAETYFGKSAAELTFVESAFLAGMVQAPTSYDPITNPERSRARFSQVLDRLVREELLTDLERATIDETFVIPERIRRREDRQQVRTHYTEAIRDYLLNRTTILGDTYEERFTSLHRGGLQIHTTIDPGLQEKAEAARTAELPANSAGIDAALTAIDNRTGAIRAMVGGAPFVAGENELNLALAPSQTGSSVKFFILAAGLEAGATPADLLDGRRPCEFSTDNPDQPVFEIRGGVDGSIADLREQTAKSVNCAFAKLSMLVGLNRVVDTIYRMAESPYLYRGQPPEEHEPIKPYPATATGANALSTLDLASGMQTIASEGIHKDPYFVEFIDDAGGNRVYTHTDNGVRVLSRDASLTAIDVLRGPLTNGTARRVLSDLAERQPAIGKTGTQDENTTSTFVGATPYLSVAVLVRDPDRYREMVNIEEFVADGVPKVQGGTYPAEIWRAFIESVGLGNGALNDWPEPPKPERKAATLALPGVDCPYVVVGYKQPAGGGGTKNDDDNDNDDGGPEGFMSPRVTPTTPPAPEPPTPEPPTPEPPTPSPTSPGQPTPSSPTTNTTAPPKNGAPPKPITRGVDTGTTVPPDVLDPNAPMPSIPLNKNIKRC